MTDTIIITWEDLRQFVLRHFRSVCKWALCVGLLTFCYLFTQPTYYAADATFRQNARQTETSFNMREVFQQYLSLPTENSTTSLLQSKELIKETLSELGLQLHVRTHGRLGRVFRNISRNVRRVLGKKIPDEEPFVFRRVHFTEEKEFSFYLKPLKDHSFVCLSTDKKVLGIGKVGQPFALAQLEFTLVQMPKDVHIDHCYAVDAIPWQHSVAWFQSALDIRRVKFDGNVLLLSFLAEDRHLGAKLLNRHLKNYQSFLEAENEEICQTQLKYLERRQGELTESFEKALTDHAAYLKGNIAQQGFLDVSEEATGLTTPRNAYLARLLDIDLDLSRLHVSDSAVVFREGSKGVEPLLQEISNVQEKVDATTTLLHTLEQGQLPPPTLLNDPKSFVGGLVKQFYTAGQDAHEQLATDVRRYLIHLEQKKRTLAEDLTLKQRGNTDFSGLTVESSKQLWHQLTAQRDGLQAQLREMIFLRDHLSQPEFELSSIGTVFQDSVTNDLLRQASGIALQLKDEHNRSSRDYERLHDALHVQKQFLSQHLFETIELLKLRGQLLEENIHALRQATLELLRSEKRLIQQKVQELHGKMQSLPEKWRKEHLLGLKKELGMRMIEGMTQLAESKNISQHLYQVTSKPIDLATPALQPQRFRPLLYSVVAMGFAAVGVFGWFFLRMVLQGVPVSFSQLKAAGFPVLGRLSSQLRDTVAQIIGEDLETLRRVAEFLTTQNRGGLSAALLGSGAVPYAGALAELLAMRGKRVVVVDYAFDQVVGAQEQLGLLQYLNREIFELPVRKRAHYDLLTSGGTTRYGTEWLASSRFTEALEQLRGQYDVVLIQSHAPMGSAEAAALLHRADVAIATVRTETREQLGALAAWGEDGGGSGRCVFVVT